MMHRNGQPTKPPRNNQGLLVVKKAIARMAFEKDDAIDMQALARELKVNYRTFRHAFKQHTGSSPQRYLLDLRLIRARHLLTQTPQTVTEIARQTGFINENHFFHYFKKKVGMTPSQWRFYSLQKLDNLFCKWNEEDCFFQR